MKIVALCHSIILVKKYSSFINLARNIDSCPIQRLVYWKSHEHLVQLTSPSGIKGIREAQGIELGLTTHQATQVLRLRPQLMLQMPWDLDGSRVVSRFIRYKPIFPI